MQSTMKSLSKGASVSMLKTASAKHTYIRRDSELPSDEMSAISGSFGEISLDYDSIYGKQNRFQSFNDCLYRTCLRPSLSLKNQLFMSFGMVTIVSLIFVMGAAIIIAIQAGNNVAGTSRDNLEYRGQQKLMASSRIFAETMSKKLKLLNGVAAILTETTKDRFVGYPDHPGYADDKLVPFKDQISGRNIYPLNASTLIPSEWEIITGNISQQNILEHLVDGRRSSFYDLNTISTASASYHMQGSCDPLATDPSSGLYYPDCTDANNNVATGGVVQPTSTAEMIHKKASDYASVVLKPLFEAHESVRNLGFYFANSGAGLEVTFPGRVSNGKISYTSIGCEWMRSPNPMDPTKQIGSEEEIARCHSNGTQVFNREFNPLEREWCRDQALDPSKPHMYGPYKEAFSNQLWIMAFGQAVYDRLTGHFIACTVVNIGVDEIARVLDQFRITDTSEIAFIRWDEEGTVVASDRWNSTQQDKLMKVSELQMGISTDIFSEMKDRFELSYKEGFHTSSYNPVFVQDDKVFAYYPVPVPPPEYDPSYTPDFALILGVDGAEIYAAVDELDEAVEDEIWQIIRSVLIAGFAGLVVVIICIYLVSIYLTMPLSWMSAVGENIIESVGSLDKEISSDPTMFLRYSPKTEVSSLLWQFQKAVKSFSGEGTARLQTYKGIEVNNPFHLHESFNHLYHKRESEQFAFVYDRSTSEILGHNNEVVAIRIHRGPNFRVPDRESAVRSESHLMIKIDEQDKKFYSSSLFWWIFATITLPLLITMIGISVYVTFYITNVLPKLVLTMEESYIQFEKKSLYPLARARAEFAVSAMSPVVMDLRLLSRVAGWLFFDGIRRSDSMTEMKTDSEACKSYSDPANNPCLFLLNRSNSVCDCSWYQETDNRTSLSCIDYQQDSRYLQTQSWFGSKLDALSNGDINSSKSFPEFASSPATTSWWSGIEAVPGYELGFNATGSGTTYEDLLKVSALSIVQIPLFNYKAKVTSRKDVSRSGLSYVAFEANGVLAGYTGCDSWDAYASNVVSNEENFAAVINPSLCPLGKYGYDPRCRPWYHLASNSYLSGGPPLYVTPPLGDHDREMVRLSGVMPIRDGSDGRNIGLIQMDFNLYKILLALTQENTPLNGDGSHVLISIAKNDLIDVETVVAPDFDIEKTPLDSTSYPLSDFILPYDVCKNGVGVECDNLANFDVILQDMKAGNSGSVEFTRTSATGKSEVVYWSYYPVTLSNGEPIDNSDFSRGITKYSTPLFSVALADTDEGLRRAFDPVRKDLESAVGISMGVLVFLISVALICVSIVSALVAISIIQPVSRLLKVVTRISTQDVNDDIPDIHGGCREVTMVHATFERLYMVVRFGNAAFFSGDLTMAYTTLKNARELFTKLKNEKAIGIANNNLGNTMLTMYRTMKKTQTPTICRLSKSQILAKGTTYFKNTIDSGEDALARINKEEGWSTNYLVFMQQLSNRYFNRALFLLTSKEDQPDPEEAERQGLMDLATAKDMDREVVDNGDTYGFKGDSTVHFELLLGRMKGIFYLIERGYNDEWDIEELFEEARKLLVNALREPGHLMFNDFEPAAKMQMLDSVLIEYYLFVKENEKAAKVAIRMLVEDEYVIGTAVTWAIKALVEYTQNCTGQDLGGEDPSDVRSKLFQYRTIVAETMASISLANPGKGGGDVVMRECAKQSAYGDVSMELF